MGQMLENCTIRGSSVKCLSLVQILEAIKFSKHLTSNELLGPPNSKRGTTFVNRLSTPDFCPESIVFTLQERVANFIILHALGCAMGTFFCCYPWHYS